MYVCTYLTFSKFKTSGKTVKSMFNSCMRSQRVLSLSARENYEQQGSIQASQLSSSLDSVETSGPPIEEVRMSVVKLMLSICNILRIKCVLILGSQTIFFTTTQEIINSFNILPSKEIKVIIAGDIQTGKSDLLEVLAKEKLGCNSVSFTYVSVHIDL